MEATDKVDAKVKWFDEMLREAGLTFSWSNLGNQPVPLAFYLDACKSPRACEALPI